VVEPPTTAAVVKTIDYHYEMREPLIKIIKDDRQQRSELQAKSQNSEMYPPEQHNVSE
jgi:hypothetical protein